jgi:hypothetical protein
MSTYDIQLADIQAYPRQSTDGGGDCSALLPARAKTHRPGKVQRSSPHKFQEEPEKGSRGGAKKVRDWGANMYTAQGAYYKKQVDWVMTPEKRRIVPAEREVVMFVESEIFTDVRETTRGAADIQAQSMENTHRRGDSNA